MKTKEEIEEKASEYVEDVKDRIDSYAYLDVQEAFQKGAEWMQEQVNDVPTSHETALNLDVVSNLVCDNCHTRPLAWVDNGKKYLKCDCGKFKQTCC